MMIRKEGCHFYINIANFDDVVLKEDERTGDVKHAVHALDTFFSSIELYGKRTYPNTFIVEKVTGARLHMYIVDDIEKIYDTVIDIVACAYELSLFINKKIGKYKSLLDFQIQVGCSYGKFYDFMFRTENKEEETTIGYAANYAAKLQSITTVGFVSISENIYNTIKNDNKKLFKGVKDERIKKYQQEIYYTARLSEFEQIRHVEQIIEYAKEFASKVNLSELIFTSPVKKINLDYLTRKAGNKIEGIPLFADVRGFTEHFKEDDSNLQEMANKTQNILTSMYNIVDNKGTHIQFQGDREFALFHNYDNYSCCEDAVLAGMKIIDAVQEYQVCVGVGLSMGKMFVAKIGARGEKDIVVLGKTVIEADSLEDDYAKENQLVIGTSIYESLIQKNHQLALQFKKLNEYCYYTTVGYGEFQQALRNSYLEKNNIDRNYNGAWKEL